MKTKCHMFVFRLSHSLRISANNSTLDSIQTSLPPHTSTNGSNVEGGATYNRHKLPGESRSGARNNRPTGAIQTCHSHELSSRLADTSTGESVDHNLHLTDHADPGTGEVNVDVRVCLCHFQRSRGVTAPWGSKIGGGRLTGCSLTPGTTA